jgi:lipid II:glycine glycyltransferase (peptidoglycan interpeptide bridge formation enzyme)
MLLDLPSSADELLAGFKSKLRSQIRKAEKNGLVFETGRDARFIDDFYRVFTVNMRDLGSPTHSRAWFESICEQFAENMIISVVKHQGQPIGAGIVLMNGSHAAIPWASTIRSFNRLSPNMLLYWSLLSYVADHGFKTFDFGRSSFGEGTYKFKQQWGAEPVALAWRSPGENGHEAIAEPSIHRKSQMRKTVESVWTRLPLPMTVLLGSRIRKYISL